MYMYNYPPPKLDFLVASFVAFRQPILIHLLLLRGPAGEATDLIEQTIATPYGFCVCLFVCLFVCFLYLPPWGPPPPPNPVGFHNFNLRIFDLRVSNPNKFIVDVFLTRCRISMCQGLGPKKTMQFRKPTVISLET